MEGVKQPPIVVTAGLAAAVLLAAIGWQLGGVMRKEPVTNLPTPDQATSTLQAQLDDRDWQAELARLGLVSTSTDERGEVATSSTSLANIVSGLLLDNYALLVESNSYTPERASEIGQNIGSRLSIPSGFVPHTEKELTKVVDTSVDRMLEYRADTRDAVAVLVNAEPPEFETFGEYIETKNPARLDDLKKAAERYRSTEQALLKVVVPIDALSLHLRVVNSLGSYAASLDQLIRYSEDALTTLTTLRAYNDAERELLYAFDALSEYYVRKISE